MSTKENLSYKTYRKTGHPQNSEQGQGWEETDVNDTLNIFDNGEARTPTLVVQKTVYDWHRQDTRMTECKDVCVTCAVTWGAGGNNMPYVLEREEQMETTIKSVDTSHADSVVRYDDIVPCMQGRQLHGGNNIQVNTVVRRLTPLECEKLQGYPSNWTNIGEWVDSKGKKHKYADSPRYKALGNSIALPFWDWLAERMINVLKEDGVENPTMASLFDGISGFCLVHKRHGCEPMWCSEIEEFPIAVCKRHFGDEKTGEKGDIEKYL